MEFTLYVNTTTKRAFASLSGGIPNVTPRLQDHLKLTVYFFATGAAPALLSSPAFNVTLKALATAGGDLFAQKVAATGSGADYYEFEWTKISNAALLEAIGDRVDGLPSILTIGWTLGGKPESVSVTATILNKWQRDNDPLPDDTDALEAAFDARAVRFDKAQDLTADQAAQALANIKIANVRSVTLNLATGALDLVGTNGDPFHIILNTGASA